MNLQIIQMHNYSQLLYNIITKQIEIIPNIYKYLNIYGFKQHATLTKRSELGNIFLPYTL